MKPNKGQFDTEALGKMGKALGWERQYPGGSELRSAKRDSSGNVTDVVSLDPKVKVK